MSASDSIRAVIAAAHRAGLPARYELSSPEEATAWRHQVYRLRQKSTEASLHNIRLIISDSEPSVVNIMPLIMGTLTGANGEEVLIVPVAPESATPRPVTAEQSAAAAFAESLGIDLGDDE